MNKKHLAELFLKFNEGKEDAFDDIYNYSHEGIFGYLMAKSHSYDIAEELTQETLVCLYNSLEKYQEKNASVTYLFQIANNIYLNYVRKNKKIVYLDDDYNGKVFGSTRSDAEDQWVIERTLSILNETESEVVYLYAVSELKHKDIAKIIDKPIGTELWIYHGAMKKLRANMEAE